MSEIEVQGLVKHMGKHLILDQVTFRIQDSELFVLLGPSGSGKTTLLRLICGLEEPDEGRILINGQDVTHLPASQRNLGVVFQDLGLYPTMDVYGNIAYSLQSRHLVRAEVEMRVWMAAEALNIQPLLKRFIDSLSGGEKQRVAVARALVKDADAYLFDEPLANLDPRLRYQARQEIAVVHRIKRRPTLYVTHDHREAFAMGQRVALLAQTRLQQVGTPDELIQSPANLYVACFIGDPPMNILPGQLYATSTSYGMPFYYLQIDGLHLDLPERWTRILKNYPVSEIVLGIRPDAILPEWAFQTVEFASITRLLAQVQSVKSLIGENVVTLRVGLRTEIVAKFDQKEYMRPGQAVAIGINREKIYLFHAYTGELLA